MEPPSRRRRSRDSSPPVLLILLARARIARETAFRRWFRQLRQRQDDRD